MHVCKKRRISFCYCFLYIQWNPLTSQKRTKDEKKIKINTGKKEKSLYKQPLHKKKK